MLTLSSPIGGDYTIPLFGTCLPSKPQVNIYIYIVYIVIILYILFYIYNIANICIIFCIFTRLYLFNIHFALKGSVYRKSRIEFFCKLQKCICTHYHIPVPNRQSTLPCHKTFRSNQST